MSRIDDLVSIIKDASTKYYEDGSSELSDSEFDKLVDELRELSPDNPILKETGWGASFNKTNEIKHLVPVDGFNGRKFRVVPYRTVLSYDNQYELDHELCIVNPKYDGISIEVVYHNGSLDKIITRGNGVTGQDVTNKLRFLMPEHVIGINSVTGELVMKEETFKEHYDESTHPRNVVSGIVNSKNDNDPRLKLLSFVAYRVLEFSEYYGQIFYSSMLESLSISGFVTTKYWDIYGSEENQQVLTSKAISLIVPLDGGTVRSDGLVLYPRVLKIDSSTTGYRPDYSDCYALKINNDSRETTVTKIDWNMSRTGVFVPLVWFDEVVISGATIRKASGNNYLSITHSKIGKGSVIKVIRSGEIIPYITEVVKQSDNNMAPTVCPYCGSKLVVEGTQLKCNNEYCIGKIQAGLEHYISTMSYGIKGLGGQMIKDFIEYLDLKTIDDIYEKKDLYKEMIYKLPSTSTYDKYRELFSNLTEKHTTIDNMLVGLNIPGLSWKSANRLAESDELIPYITAQIAVMDKPAGVMAKSFDWIFKNREYLHHLYDISGIFIKRESVSKVDDSKKLKICVTGALSTVSSRGELFSTYGAHIVESPIKSCDYLVTNEQSNSSKYRYATSNNIKIITESDLLNLINSMRN